MNDLVDEAPRLPPLGPRRAYIEKILYIDHIVDDAGPGVREPAGVGTGLACRGLSALGEFLKFCVSVVALCLWVRCSASLTQS